ncbi:MAG: bifunctional (p)ppGpp synthetase/guanosine-3',5'-bis(diphosphate) 3'-pyrophosphohydrolase [Halofilum sp. (in: g-proteobacteria)]|nr:bifunctional (p)ppGpp synthetase/guanosine-3',5'-bis(diphosphate) 3'-pyrophosphohydrolase [Halofilum sp. (in: g-proteobacteria)]
MSPTARRMAEQEAAGRRMAPVAPDRYTIDDLCAELEPRLDADALERIRRAYTFGARAHEGQQRLTGEAYITHPLSVARTVSELSLDADSIVAALLHDVLEDTSVPRERIEADFGETVARLVDGLSKLTHLSFNSRAEQQAANFQKMMLAMVDDIRVVLIKLADRLHNMRTLDVMPVHKRHRIARETLDIYAPIANRLGINTLKHELEDLAFAALYPMRYRILAEAVRRARGNRKELMQKIEIVMVERLHQEGLDARVIGREKPLYSMYRKMREKHLSFHEVFDKFAIRVIVDSVDTCYRTLGLLHNLYKPVPGRFKDYIAIPKGNGYQSLHTALFGPHSIAIEVQIRTADMDRFAESGIAAHWLYKSRGDDAEHPLKTHGPAREWLRSLLDMQQSTGSSVEFLEHVKMDLFPDEMYVFSPRGDIYKLPAQSTVIDFAYAVHSQIGHTCVAAKIDRRLSPLSTPLHSGQTVEVVTAPGSTPSPLWLNFVVTAKARSAIRHYLKHQATEEATEFGRRLVRRHLDRYGMTIDDIEPERMQRTLTEFGYRDADHLWIEVGLGNRLPSQVVKRLVPEDRVAATGGNREKTGVEPVLLEGGDSMVVSFARCCRPIPGDNIQGFLSAGKGVVIHRADCSNVADYRRRPDKWLPVEWAPDVEGEFSACITVEVMDRRGVLARVATLISDQDANIEHLEFEDRDRMTSVLRLVLSVHHRVHLARIIRTLRQLPAVMRVRRETR